MINGDVNRFVDNLYYGEEMNFTYADKYYFIEGLLANGLYLLKLEQLVPLINYDDLWSCESESSQICVNKFLEAKVFNGKTFWEVEQDIEWIDAEPDNLIEATKEYIKKHPKDEYTIKDLELNINGMIKISDMSSNFQNLVKNTNFATIKNNEFYNNKGEILFVKEFVDWYYKNKEMTKYD